MGSNLLVDFEREKFPIQGDLLGKEVDVCFNYGTKYLVGKIIRDDREGNLTTIIQLEDGRVIWATECQYHLRHHWKAEYHGYTVERRNVKDV